MQHSDGEKEWYAEARRLEDRMHDTFVAVCRSVGVLNSAGAIAMLGFMQALVGKDLLGSFKFFGTAALALYIGGAVLAVMPLVARFQYLQWKLAEKSGKMAELSREMWNWLKASGACFVVAGILVILGIQRTF